MNNEEIQFMFGQGGLESPIDSRSVYVEEIAGAGELPEEFFSPYLVAAYLRNGTNNQRQRNSCVMESSDKMNESMMFWNATPDSTIDGQVIDYLFDLINGKIVNKKSIEEKAQNFSPQFGYYIAKQIDGIPNANGTYVYMAGKVAVEYGLCEERLNPSNASYDQEITKPPIEAYENAKNYKIERYLQTQNTFDSYKLGIMTGNANLVVGGFPTGGGANLGVQPQKPPITQPDNGHAITFFGFDKNYRYALGSWGEGYGLTLYLKIYNHPKFGKIFVRGTEQDNVVAIRGCHQLGVEWFPAYAYRAVLFYDQKFPAELEQRIHMLKVIMEKETGRTFAILKGKRYMLTDPVYEAGRGEIWVNIPLNELLQVEKKDITVPYGGNFGKIDLVNCFKAIVGSI